MAAINDMSDTTEAYSSETVPVSREGDSAKYNLNPHENRGRSSGPYAATTTHVNDRVSNTQQGKGLSHVAEGEKKHGGGPHNWGNVSDPDDLNVTSSDQTKVPAEKVLEPESAAEERRARKEADNAGKGTKTLEEYEAEGHKV